MADDSQQVPAPNNLDALEQQFAEENKNSFPSPAAWNPAAPAQEAAPQAQGPVNVFNPDGELVSIDAAHLPAAIKQGFKQASSQDVDAHFDQEKYSTPGQQLATAAEGALESATLGMGAGIPSMMGLTTPEAALKRREINPIAHGAGQVAGLVGSSLLLPGAGAAGVLEGAGVAGAKALGLGAAESTAAKIGSAAIKSGIENAVFQGTDELAKSTLGDPNSAETMAANVGLSGLLGGVIGGVASSANPLWKATLGKETTGVLKAITDKLGGIEGQIPDSMEDALVKSGVEVTPAIRATFIDNPSVQQEAKKLLDSTTGPGLKLAAETKAYRESLQDAAMSAMGKSKEDLASLEHFSENKAGEEIKDSLMSKIKDMYTPVEKSYEKISNKFKGMELSEAAKADLSEAVAKTLNPGVSAESAEAKLVNRVLKEIPGLNNLEQLRNYTSSLGNETSGIAKQELWGVARKLKGAFNNAGDNALSSAVEANAPELLAEHVSTKSAYRQLKDTIGELNDRLKVGPHGGPKTFLSALKDMDGEAVLRRLSPKNKSDIISELSKSFPDVAEQVRKAELDKVLRKVTSITSEGAKLDTQKLVKTLPGLSPEMREFILPKDTMEKINAVRTLLERVPMKEGLSGTPRALDGIMAQLPPSAAAMITMLMGHSPVTAAAVGYLTKALGRDIPDAARYALLKFLGSSSPVDAAGFKTMAEAIHNTIRGENLVGNAAKNMFKAGKEVIPASMMPNEHDRSKLDKQIKEINKNPTAMIDANSSMGHYMPEHATMASQVSTNAINYLNTLRPDKSKGAPLDSKPVASGTAKAEYNNALNIAQQPLIVLDKIKKGTITTQDLTSLKTMYPNLYNKLAQKLTDEMVNHIDKGESVPYRTRMGLSLFTGQPLDSTMKPDSIMSAQPKAPQQQQGADQDQRPKHSMTALNKVPGSYMTQQQAREAKSLKD